MYREIYGVLAVIITVGVVIFNIIAKKNKGKDRVYAISFAALLTVGTFLYLFAIDFNNDARYVFSPFFKFFVSFLAAMSTFFGSFNSSTHFSNLASESAAFQTAIILHYLAAMYMTILLVIKLFGKKIMNEIRIMRILLGEKYIVIGCEGKAKVFLRNLSRKIRQNAIVIVQSSQDDKKWQLVDKGYSVVSLKGGGSAYAVYRDALKKAGAMKCRHETRIISMAEKDETNLLIARIMTDYIVNNIKPQSKDGHIFLTEEQEKETLEMKLDVRIMHSNLDRAEHYTFVENALGKIMFFNHYKINAHKFWWENPITKLIPSSWIDTEKAKLKTNEKSESGQFKICTIFAGFGSANKDLLKTSVINNQLLNADYNAFVISQNASRLEKVFRNSAAGLFDETDKDNNIIKRGAELKPNINGSVYLENPKEKNIIKFKDADALTFDFYESIIKEIEGKKDDNGRQLTPQCDYATVIIALGDDKLNIETAMELRQKLYKADLLTGKDGGTEYQRVKIFVKINENTVITDEKLINFNAEEIKCRIVTCCDDDDVLTVDYILNEKLDILAKNIANRYEGSGEKNSAISEWNTCTQYKRESNRNAAMAIQIKLNLLGLDLVNEKESNNDYENLYKTRYGLNRAFDLRAERKKTEKEIALARNNEKNGQTVSDKLLTLKIDDELIHIAEHKNNDFADTPRNNLAMLEHQRWNAFYLANDWTKLPVEKIGAGSPGRQNGIAKLHACITTFHGLKNLMVLQKDAEKKEISGNKNKSYIEAESLLKADTIRHDFNTMDFLLDLSGDNLKKMREVEGNPDKEYTGILTSSGYYIGKF